MVPRSQHFRMQDDVDRPIRFTVLRKTNIERPDIGTGTSYVPGDANLTIQLPDCLPMESQRSPRLTNIIVTCREGGDDDIPLSSAESNIRHLHARQIELQRLTVCPAIDADKNPIRGALDFAANIKSTPTVSALFPSPISTVTPMHLEVPRRCPELPP